MSSNSFKLTAACVVMMMMMVEMIDTAAMAKAGSRSKHSEKTHRKSSDDAAVETVPLQLDPQMLVPTRTIVALQNASISPWTYNVSHDATLFPSVMSDARCLLRGCLDSEGVEDLGLESKPILHHVLLLRRVRSEGAEHSYHYRLESRLVAVGCTCVRPISQQQQ